MHKAQSIRRLLPILALLSPVALPLDAASAQDSIKVGIILPLTGSQAFFGAMERDSFALALEEINESEGVRGKPLEFVFEDDRGRPEHGAEAAVKLIEDDGVVMLGGGYSSAVTLRVAEVAQSRRMPFLVNTGAADAITEGGRDHVFEHGRPGGPGIELRRGGAVVAMEAHPVGAHRVPDDEQDVRSLVGRLRWRRDRSSECQSQDRRRRDSMGPHRLFLLPFS